jgi:hypothetical protein
MPYIQHRTVLKKFNAHDEEVIDYFAPCSDLLTDEYRYEVVISYMFSRIEIAHREVLYFGVVKLHEVDSKLARTIINEYDLQCGDFRTKFEQIYGYRMPAELREKIESAEKVRDRILHGKKNKEAGDMGRAILDTMDYLTGLNDLLYEKSRIWIAGDRRGMMGNRASHSKASSKWILMGMGLIKSPKA